jgi:hypothetical protein
VTTSLTYVLELFRRFAQLFVIQKKVSAFSTSASSLIHSVATHIGYYVIDRIIPLIDRIRRAVPCTFSTMFSPHLLPELEAPQNLQFHDLRESDAFFDSLIQKYASILFFG